MNILIKLTCLVGLVIAPILGGHAATEEQALHMEQQKKEIRVEVKATGDGETTTAVIKTTKVINGEETTEEKTVEGTMEEIEAAVEEIKE